jgi:hypothetical protein
MRGSFARPRGRQRCSSGDWHRGPGWRGRAGWHRKAPHRSPRWRTRRWRGETTSWLTVCAQPALMRLHRKQFHRRFGQCSQQASVNSPRDERSVPLEKSPKLRAVRNVRLAATAQTTCRKPFLLNPGRGESARGVDGYVGPGKRSGHLLCDDLAQFCRILRQTWPTSSFGKQHNIIHEPGDRDRANCKKQRARKNSDLLLIRMP